MSNRTFLVWHCSSPEYFDLERAIKRNGVAKHTVSASSPILAAKEWATADMVSRHCFGSITVVVFEDGKRVGAFIVTCRLVPQTTVESL